MNETAFSLKQRIVRPRTLISLAVALLMIVALFRLRNISIHDIFLQVKTIDPLWYLGAVVCYYLSFPVRGLRWRRLLAGGGLVLKWRDATRYLFLGWFGNCLAPAKAGEALRAWLVRSNHGRPMAWTFGTVVAERSFDIVVLPFALAASAMVKFGSAMPPVIRWTLWIGLALGVMVTGGVIMLMRTEWLLKMTPARIRPHLDRFQTGIRQSFNSGMPVLIALTLLTWTLESSRMFFLARAFGLHFQIADCLIVALTASALTVIPFTPAGLGFADVGIAGLLAGLYKLDNARAVTMAGADRVITYWMIIILGAVIYLAGRRRRSGS